MSRDYRTRRDFLKTAGTGAAALQELEDQTTAYVAGEELHANVYPHQIFMNVLPHVDDFFDDGYTAEEHKMINETRKMAMIFPHMTIFPCIAISSLILGFNLLADGLREISLRD